MMVAVARDVHRKLTLLSALEGLTVEELVHAACELLCESYVTPRSRPPAAAPEPPDVSRPVVAAPTLPVVAKRGRGRPRKVRPDLDERCFVCDHTRGEHCGENGKCLSARCVCLEFT